MDCYNLYKLSFPNGKIYIGQTNNFTLRMQQHKSAAFKGYCRLVDKAIRKYGWENISKEIILTCDKDSIDAFEREYIKLLNTTNHYFGYNLDSGGNKNKVHSEETKRKISLSHIGMRPSAETLAKVSITRRGVKRKPHSEETKLKMSLASKGRPKSLQHRQTLSLVRTGLKRKPHSEEVKEKIRISNIEASKHKDYSVFKTEEYRKKQSEGARISWLKR